MTELQPETLLLLLVIDALVAVGLALAIGRLWGRAQRDAFWEAEARRRVQENESRWLNHYARLPASVRAGALQSIEGGRDGAA